LKYKVSVITPCHNSAKFISKTIESVRNQTLQDWEMIIIDDHSSDNSVEIIKLYSKKDSRIKLVRLGENSGAAVARNTAISRAQGRYIAFLDADDLWLPSKLERQIDFMRNNNLAFTYSSYYLVDKDGKMIGSFTTKENITYTSMLKTCSVGCSTAIYDFDKLGKIYMPLISKRQDYGLWLEILRRIGSTKGINEPLASYRILSDSLSSNKFKAAYYQWKIYRKVKKLNFLISTYYFLHYFKNGIFKYKTNKSET